MSPERRQDLICGAVLLLIWLAVWIPRLNGPINLRWDASTYYVLGTALAEGKGYRLLNEPGEIESVQYPPLLPVIVAAHQRVMGTSDYFEVGSRLRFSYFVLSGLYLLAVYALARELLAPLYALLVGAITGLSFTFLHLSDTLYAEIPFALVSTLFLLCNRCSDQRPYAAVTGLLGAAAYFLRTAGLALLASWVAESLIRRRFRQAVIRAAISTTPVLLWQVHIWRVTESDEYQQPAYAYQRAPYYYANVTYGENSSLVDPFCPELGRTKSHDLAGRVIRNLAAIPLGLGESAWTAEVFGPFLLDELQRKFGVPLPARWRTISSRTLCGCLVAAGLLAVVGAIFVATGPEWFLALYFGLTVGMVTLTWQSQFWRYLAPLAPLTLIFLVLALLAIRRLPFRNLMWRRTAGALVMVLLAEILLVQVSVAVSLLRSLPPVSYYDAAGREQLLRLLTYESHWHSLDPAFEWVRRHATAGAVLATTVPHLAYLRTQHKAVLPPLERDTDTAGRLLDEVPVSYLVLDELRTPPISTGYAAPVIAQQPENWRLVYAAPGGGTKVYERVHRGSETDTTPPSVMHGPAG
jgi:hypothetical protein